MDPAGMITNVTLRNFVNSLTKCPNLIYVTTLDTASLKTFNYPTNSSRRWIGCTPSPRNSNIKDVKIRSCKTIFVRIPTTRHQLSLGNSKIAFFVCAVVVGVQLLLSSGYQTPGSTCCSPAGRSWSLRNEKKCRIDQTTSVGRGQ